MMATLALSTAFRCSQCRDSGYVPVRHGPRTGDCDPCARCTIDRDDEERDDDAYVDHICDRADEARASVFAGAREDWGHSR